MLCRVCHILGACEKLTSVSILGECKYYSWAPLWKILPGGLTSLKTSDAHFDVNVLLQLDKLRELCIDSNTVADLQDAPTSISIKVAAAPFSEILNALH